MGLCYDYYIKAPCFIIKPCQIPTVRGISNDLSNPAAASSRHASPISWRFQRQRTWWMVTGIACCWVYHTLNSFGAYIYIYIGIIYIYQYIYIYYTCILDISWCSISNVLCSLKLAPKKTDPRLGGTQDQDLTLAGPPVARRMALVKKHRFKHNNMYYTHICI